MASKIDILVIVYRHFKVSKYDLLLMHYKHHTRILSLHNYKNNYYDSSVTRCKSLHSRLGFSLGFKNLHFLWLLRLLAEDVKANGIMFWKKCVVLESAITELWCCASAIPLGIPLSVALCLYG